jgi:hypothetical protein
VRPYLLPKRQTTNEYVTFPSRTTGLSPYPWEALTLAVMENGKLGYVQPIGASPDKVDANSTEVYGVGAFLLAGTEIYHFLKKRPLPGK